MESDPVSARFQYSIDASDWKNSKRWTGVPGEDYTNLPTSKTGKKYSYYWDTSDIKGESNNVKFRIKIQEKSTEIGTYMYSTVAATTKQFGYGKPPNIPAGFGCSKITINSAKLYWDINLKDESVVGYEIYINKTNSTGEYKFLHNEINGTTYNIYGLAENTSYYFKILAYDAVGFQSDLSQRIGCRTLNSPPEVKSSWKPKVIVVLEDNYDNKSLNLYDAFYDPTGDPLKFNVMEPNNFTIKILDNGDVHLKPKKDWFGTEYLNFTADDGQGVYHSSSKPPIAWIIQKVEVTPVNDPPRQIKPLGSLQLFEDPDNSTKINLNNYFDDSADQEILNFRVEGHEYNTITITPDGYAEIMPNKNWHGREMVIIYASDESKELYDFLSIVVTPINDVPKINTTSLFWETGKWQNETFDVYDPDEMDILIITSNLDQVLPGLIVNENYNFNLQTGEISVLVSENMAGYYKFNVTVNDGTESVTKTISLSIVAGSNGPNGKKDSSKEGMDFTTLMIILLIIVIIIILAVYFVVQWHKKSQKISFIKCPSCGQSVVHKGKGKINCEICGKTIDPSTKETDVIPIHAIAKPPAPLSTRQYEPRPMGPETTQVSGGYYPKSTLSGSVLDKPIEETFATPEPKPAPVAQPATAVPIPVPTAKPQPTVPVQPQPVPKPVAPTPAPATPAAPTAPAQPTQQGTPLTTPPKAAEEETKE
jgi:outer membrane biosynthesis protein TonB